MASCMAMISLAEKWESTQLYLKLPQQLCFFGDLHAAFTTTEQYPYLLSPKPQPNQTLRMWFAERPETRETHNESRANY